MVSLKFSDFVLVCALENAVSYGGKCNPKALIGKCMPNFPEMKKDMSGYMKIINSVCEKVNKMSVDEQKKELERLSPDSLNKNTPKKEKREGLSDLENVKGKIRVRTEPAPSGYLHIGHAYNIVFNYEYVKKYGGEFILRFGDTNPDNIDVRNYASIEDTVNWLTDNGVDEVYCQSERVEIYYKYLKKLLKEGAAYVCKCDPEDFKKLNDASKACPHRDTDPKSNLQLFEDMKSGKLKDGDAVIRFKADLKNKNPALRDFPIARINSNSHARVGKKYRVWPMMNLTVAIDDVDMKITHVIRGKDHEINMERQKMIHKVLKMKSPEYFHIGRVKFDDINLSKSDLSKLIAEDKYEGWDDPRVPTLISYKKRGYQAEAFRKLVVASGISKRDSKITSKEYHKSLDFFNKQILDPICPRYYFVSYEKDPKVVVVSNTGKLPNEIEIAKHPENSSLGKRKLKVKSGKFYIDYKDFDSLKKGEILRLKNFANFKVNKIGKDEAEIEFVSKEFDRSMKLCGNIQFVPFENPVRDSTARECFLYMPDNSLVKGFVENIEGEIKNVQFERVGFVNYTRTGRPNIKLEGNEMVFYFTQG